MCGRFVLATPVERLVEFFDAAERPGLSAEFRPSWNIPPTQQILGVAEDRGERLLDTYHWGLVPSWAKDLSGANRAFNARAETLPRRASFRKAFASRRLLIPADSFYEWQRLAGARLAYAFSRRDGAPLALAGLWELWRHPEGRWIRSCTMITTAAGPDMAGVHDRMPAVIEVGDFEEWLDPAAADLGALQHLLAPAPAGTLVCHRVGSRVNSVRNDDPSLVEPEAEEARKT